MGGVLVGFFCLAGVSWKEELSAERSPLSGWPARKSVGHFLEK